MNHFFKQIERKTGVSMEEIFALANAIQHADFTNEKQVRKIVRRVSQVANKPITKELEDRIVQSILQNGENIDLNSIQRMLG
ncbi:stage VI sporulation protein F [Ureibacillus thermophilus]|uniref:Sporulation protein n=1 Tax=Ureibacillus thermophilus TaxID=367743 RepID=A0A4P6US36_9BACL|nr:stage VI sporulation protein F [Ureibacillus thermophilus]QBK25447.1 sporulation protein [Ureibacillus thermophilus]